MLRRGYPTGQTGTLLTTSSILNPQGTAHPIASPPYHQQNIFGHYQISHSKAIPSVLYLCPTELESIWG